MKKINLLVVDDHPLMRKGIISIFEETNEYDILEAWDVKSAYEVIRETSPDIIIIDVSLPDGSGISVIEEILKEEKFEALKFIVVSVNDSPENYYRAVKAGALGFMGKDIDRRYLLTGVQTVLNGGRYFSGFTVEELEKMISGFETIHFPERDPEKIPLSKREEEILLLVYKGYTNQQISETLFIHIKTVEAHRSKLMGKFKVNSIGELNLFINSSERLKKICKASVLDITRKDVDA